MKLIWISNKKVDKPRFIHHVGVHSADNSVLIEYRGRQITAVFADCHAECLNAQNSEKEMIFWAGADFNKIKALSPKENPYGWVLASLNTPLYLTVANLNQLKELSEIEFEGIYSEDLSLLEEIYNLQN